MDARPPGRQSGQICRRGSGSRLENSAEKLLSQRKAHRLLESPTRIGALVLGRLMPPRSARAQHTVTSEQWGGGGLSVNTVVTSGNWIAPSAEREQDGGGPPTSSLLDRAVHRRLWCGGVWCNRRCGWTCIRVLRGTVRWRALASKRGSRHRPDQWFGKELAATKPRPPLDVAQARGRLGRLQRCRQRRCANGGRTGGRHGGSGSGSGGLVGHWSGGRCHLGGRGSGSTRVGRRVRPSDDCALRGCCRVIARGRLGPGFPLLFRLALNKVGRHWTVGTATRSAVSTPRYPDIPHNNQKGVFTYHHRRRFRFRRGSLLSRGGLGQLFFLRLGKLDRSAGCVAQVVGTILQGT